MGETYWQTNLSYTSEDGIYIRGYDLVELIGNVPFPSALYLLYTGELPEPHVARLIDAVMVASIDHGPGAPSVLAARTAVSGGASLGPAAAAGLLTLGEFHGAAVQASMEAIQSVVDLTDAADGANTLAGTADRVVADWRRAKRRISGFGHRQHKQKDPRLARLFGLAEEAGVAGRYLEAAQALEQALKRAVGKDLPINIDGAMAAASWVPMVVAFNSLFPAHEAVRATAMLTLANSGGRILATSSTGMLNTWGGYTLPFFLAAGAAGLGILFMLPTREETRPRLTPSPGRITQLITRQDVLLPSLLAAIGEYAIWSTTFGFSPILAKQLGGGDIIQSMLVTMNLAAVIVGNLSATVLASRIGVHRLVLFSFLMLAGSVGLTAAATSLSVLFAAQFFIGLSNGVNFPVLMGLSIRYVGDSERNTAMGLFQSVYALGKFGGPWCSGILAHLVGLRWMLAVTALGTLVLGLLGASRFGEEG